MSDFPVCIITRAPRSLEERARSVEARARMIERSGYGFGERAAALLGSAATADTLALVQQTVRATNPVGFMQAACFIAEAEMPPLAAGLTMPLLMVQGEEDRVASAATNAELLAAALPHALAPKEAEFVDTVPPRYFGGNVDDWRIGKGAAMYYPVAVPGALFSVGDPHASYFPAQKARC